MRLSHFDYYLPKELIAQYPLFKREEARLMVVAGNNIYHKKFRDIGEFINKDDILVLNNTGVFKARLEGRRESGAKVEVFILQHIRERVYEVLLRPKRVRVGEYIIFDSGSLKAKVLEEKKLFVEFDRDIDVDKLPFSNMPLPPYIKRAVRDFDEEYYQTVYAQEKKSVASPTAGLHFSRSLLQFLLNKGVRIAEITLHIGYGTFRPVKEDNFRRHHMYGEYIIVRDDVARLINNRKGRLIAVGTTVARALESVWWQNRVYPFDGFTELFIHPQYRFKCIDALITNFHLPRTTLLMLVCAFGGYDNIMRAYKIAVKEKYRFYSYGDAMFILNRYV